MDEGCADSLWLLCGCSSADCVLANGSIAQAGLCVLVEGVSRLHVLLVPSRTGILGIAGGDVGTGIHWVGRSVRVGSTGGEEGNRPG